MLGVEGVLHRIRILVVVEEDLLRVQVAVEEGLLTWVAAVEAVQHLQPSEEVEEVRLSRLEAAGRRRCTARYRRRSDWRRRRRRLLLGELLLEVCDDHVLLA